VTFKIETVISFNLMLCFQDAVLRKIVLAVIVGQTER
jgi:hypothetical protein